MDGTGGWVLSDTPLPSTPSEVPFKVGGRGGCRGLGGGLTSLRCTKAPHPAAEP